MPVIDLTTLETDALAHFAAQTAYLTPPAGAPTSSLLRAAEEIRPLGSILEKFKAGIEASLDATTNRPVNHVFAGPASGSPGPAVVRALVAADIPDITAAKISDFAGVAAAAAPVQSVAGKTGAVTLDAADINTALTYTAANAAALDASNLTTGTIPDARFPAVLPAISGANLTNLPGGISGLTAGVIPVAASGSAIANSKMTASGANGGTWTLWDDTATVGATTLVLRPGAAQTDTSQLYPLIKVISASTGGAVSAYPLVGTADGVHVTVSADSFKDGQYSLGFEMNSAALSVRSGYAIKFASSDVFYDTPDFGLSRAGVNAGKATNGSTGYSQWRCQSLAVNNSAAGSTPGTCVKKIEVFDVAGVSLGFLPVYDAIT